MVDGLQALNNSVTMHANHGRPQRGIRHRQWNKSAGVALMRFDAFWKDFSGKVLHASDGSFIGEVGM